MIRIAPGLSFAVFKLLLKDFSAWRLIEYKLLANVDRVLLKKSNFKFHVALLIVFIYYKSRNEGWARKKYLKVWLQNIYADQASYDMINTNLTQGPT